MPWLKRGEHSYFYQSKTVRGKEVTTYLGRGATAQEASRVIESRKELWAKLAVLRRQHQLDDILFQALSDRIHTEISAVLCPKGFHRHRTKWLIKGKGQKAPQKSPTTINIIQAETLEQVRLLAIDLCNSAADSLKEDPDQANLLQSEIQSLRTNLISQNQDSLLQMMNEQVLSAHTINLVTMAQQEGVPDDDLSNSLTDYWELRMRKTHFRLCCSVAILTGLKRISTAWKT